MVLVSNLPETVLPAKPRPAFVLKVNERSDGHFQVVVVYGTTQKLTVYYPHNLIVSPAQWPQTGLRETTRFDCSLKVELPWTKDWFSVPNWNMKLTTPILGCLPVTDPNFKLEINSALKAALVVEQRRQAANDAVEKKDPDESAAAGSTS